MRPVFKMLLAGAVAMLPASAALAQQGGGPGVFNPQAMAKWSDQHKYTFQLRTMLTNGVSECERSKSTQLKPAQAKQILAVLTPLTKKPKLTQDEAKANIQKLQRVFNARQLAAVDKSIQAGSRRGGPGGGGPGGGGPRAGGPPGGGGPGAGGPGGRGPGGGGPGGSAGNRPRFDPARMKNFNPFNPEKSSPMYDRTLRRNKSLTTFLQARAAGKMDAKLDMPRGFGGGPGGGRPGGGSGGNRRPQL